MEEKLTLSKQVNYHTTSDLETAKKWIEELYKRSLIACDFETAVRYSPEDYKDFFRTSEDDSQPFVERKKAEALTKVTALDHPTHSLITHFSVAWSDEDSYVFILDSFDITKLVLDFLTNTNAKQVWFNAVYDFKFIYFLTHKFPKNYEDAQLYLKTLLNHVEPQKAKASLKDLAGGMYGDWGLDSDIFSLDNLYDPKLLKYAAIDSCATFWVWNRILNGTEDSGDYTIRTDDKYSPWDQLPMPNPVGADLPESYFYHNTAKFLIKDTVKIMVNALPIKLEEVAELEKVLVDILDEVADSLANNPTVRAFLENVHKDNIGFYIKDRKSMLRSPSYYKKPLNLSNIEHRSFCMEVIAKRLGIDSPELIEGDLVPKWSVKLVRKLATQYPVMNKVVDKSLPPDGDIATEAMNNMAAAKAEKHNKKYIDQINNAKDIVPFPVFNPASSLMKQKIFAWLGIKSEAVSEKTGDDSWDREQITLVNKTTPDEDVKSFTSTLIDHSFAAIVKNNFIAAFYRYSFDDPVHEYSKLAGQYKLLGAKSGRYTSSNPNMLNTPSSRSIFSKPVKKCFTAPEGFIVATTDFSALEDRVIANLSQDQNKLGIFTKGFDGHCLAAYFYWPEEVKKFLPAGLSGNDESIIMFKKMVDEKHLELDEIRSNGKAISFGLA